MTELRDVVTKRCSDPSDAVHFLRRGGFKQTKDDDGKVIWKRVRNNHVQVARASRERGTIVITIKRKEG